MTLFRLPRGATCPTMPGATRRVHVGIAWAVFVALAAMRLCALYLSAFVAGFAALRIDAVRHRIKVIRPHARRDTAQVIKLKTVWYGAVAQFIAEPMRRNQPDAIPEVPISEWRTSGGPKPACSGLFYLWPKSLFRRLGRTSKSASIFIVEHRKCFI